jgi:hypothetical protein
MTSDRYNEERNRHDPRKIDLRWRRDGRLRIEQPGCPPSQYAVKVDKRGGITIEAVEERGVTG